MNENQDKQISLKSKHGSELKSVYLANGSFTKYQFPNNEMIYLKTVKSKFNFKLSVYYKKNEYVKALQLVFYNSSRSLEILTSPRIFGFSETWDNSIVEEISLNLQPNELIYKILGLFKNDRIEDLEIYTTKGQFVKLRPGFEHSNSQFNFIQEYCHNSKLFDGFIVGWNENNINYIEFLNRDIIQIPVEIEESISKKLDATQNYENPNNFKRRLIYKTHSYGLCNQDSIFEDDYKRLFASNNQNVNIGISSICVYYDKYINCIEAEYQDYSNNDKFKICHIGSESNSNNFS